MSELKMLDDKEDEKMGINEDELQVLRSQLSDDYQDHLVVVRSEGTYVYNIEENARSMAALLCSKERKVYIVARIIVTVSPEETPVSWKEV